MVFIICLTIGILTAFIGSIAGLGGGIILVPSLFLMYSISDDFSWATPQVIVGVSLVTMIFTGLSSAIAYLKAKRVDIRTAVYFLAGSIPGGMIGAWFIQFVNADQFTLYFGFVMILISLLLFIKRDRVKPKAIIEGKRVRTFHLHGVEYKYQVSPTLAFFLALGVGILSGLFGIGGGSIMVPLMILLFGIPAHIATATSMFMIFFVSISGSITHIALGHIAWEYVWLFIPGAWIGGKLGAKVNQLITGKALAWILRILLIIVGIRMIIQGLS